MSLGYPGTYPQFLTEAEAPLPSFWGCSVKGCTVAEETGRLYNFTALPAPPPHSGPWETLPLPWFPSSSSPGHTARLSPQPLIQTRLCQENEDPGRAGAVSRCSTCPRVGGQPLRKDSR